MALSNTVMNHLESALCDRQSANLVASILGSAQARKTLGAAITPATVNATTGTLPTANGAILFANAASPTVAELMDAVVELQTQVTALINAAKA